MPPSSIIKECSTFLKDAGASPLYKMLPSVGEGFRRVKIRKKSKHEHLFERYFDMAFGSEYKDLRLRSMIAQTNEPIVESNGMEVFYVFPIDGYRILYNKQIPDYAQYIEALSETIHNTNSVEELLTHLFQYAYQHGTAKEAAESGTDVLVYDIPYYYAVRKSLITNYNDFITY